VVAAVAAAAHRAHTARAAAQHTCSRKRAGSACAPTAPSPTAEAPDNAAKRLGSATRAGDAEGVHRVTGCIMLGQRSWCACLRARAQRAAAEIISRLAHPKLAVGRRPALLNRGMPALSNSAAAHLATWPPGANLLAEHGKAAAWLCAQPPAAGRGAARARRRRGGGGRRRPAAAAARRRPRCGYAGSDAG
jgi:hypothetical protein